MFDFLGFLLSQESESLSFSVCVCESLCVPGFVYLCVYVPVSVCECICVFLCLCVQDTSEYLNRQSVCVFKSSKTFSINRTQQETLQHQPLTTFHLILISIPICHSVPNSRNMFKLSDSLSHRKLNTPLRCVARCFHLPSLVGGVGDFFW